MRAKDEVPKERTFLCHADKEGDPHEYVYIQTRVEEVGRLRCLDVRSWRSEADGATFGSPWDCMQHLTALSEARRARAIPALVPGSTYDAGDVRGVSRGDDGSIVLDTASGPIVIRYRLNI